MLLMDRSTERASHVDEASPPSEAILLCALLAPHELSWFCFAMCMPERVPRVMMIPADSEICLCVRERDAGDLALWRENRERDTERADVVPADLIVPVVAALKEKTTVIEIDASGGVDDIAAVVAAEIEKLK